ncbi:TIGR03364 family FAD-dependent oxidoreductase [Acinetobacter bohemicus]|uniref:TIGR03364 family FAD-dependent oxidoreductase n=1 Tax=Acinetobacter TaxID=469 RepID=UPI00209B0F88|nr:MULTISPECIES: TIGR03364 family FAD-dependent oxidoreductase [Acinetobacter]MCO8041639.1 TIGR03364 family FAD-dependent oxidoreductase [Acinetobacter sp. S4400-12]MCU7223663.1 TIGR03364 family FAD-dependent oxidoreductase [Acinetobacter bohemicus]
MNTAKTDLIIVGAGILGLSAAIQAAEQGLKVQLFEKDAQPVGATRRNFGMVGTSTLSRPDAKWRQYALETRKFYQRIQAQHDISFQQRDGLYLANTALEWQVLNEFAQAAPDYQIPVELLSRTQVFERYGYLDHSANISGALIFQEDYSVEPHLAGHRLLQYAKQLGIEIYCNACVVRTRYHRGYAEIQLASGQHYRAEKVLICHGETTQILYPELLQHLGLQRCALQMALTQPLAHDLKASIYSGLSISRYPAFEICPSHQALKEESQQGLVKDYGIHILIKQNEFGQIILGDSHEYHAIQDTPQFNQREEINQFILKYCKEKIGLKLPAIESRWNGYYLTHPQELACVTEAEPNIYLISAIAGKGMTTGAGFMQEVLKNHIL